MITGSEDRAFDLISIIDSVEGAPDGASALIEDVRVDHRCGDIPMTEQLLDGADVVAVLKKVGGETVGQGVATCGLGNIGGVESGLGSALDDRFMQMVPAVFTGVAVPVASRGRKHPLPRRLRAGGGILACQCVGQRHAPAAVREAAYM